nr:hypothetical protein GTC16762_09010 [Pigmentibacter ruber]
MTLGTQKTEQNSFCWIHLNNIKTFLYLGANEFEEKIGQNITIKLSLKIKYEHTQDNLENTVDYGLVYEFVLQQIKSLNKVKLLEYLCEQLLNGIQNNFPNIYAAKISIEKGYVPLKHFTGYVVIEAEKDFSTQK